MNRTRRLAEWVIMTDEGTEGDLSSALKEIETRRLLSDGIGPAGP